MMKKEKLIDKTSALICNETDACMRCVRICHFLYHKRRLFTDYPVQVAMMVQGKIYFRDVNHSEHFAAQFLKHFAAECLEEIKVMLDEEIPQIGFRQPVK